MPDLITFIFFYIKIAALNNALFPIQVLFIINPIKLKRTTVFY